MLYVHQVSRDFLFGLSLQICVFYVTMINDVPVRSEADPRQVVRHRVPQQAVRVRQPPVKIMRQTMGWLEYIINISLQGRDTRRKILTYTRTMRHLITIHGIEEPDPELDINDLCVKMKYLLTTQGGTRMDPSLDVAELCSLLESNGTIRETTSKPTLAPSSLQAHMTTITNDTPAITGKRFNQLCIAQGDDDTPTT
jgi:hypothetical protein